MDHPFDEAVGSVEEAARSLLGRIVTAHGVSVRLTEVEAYGGVLDPASHAFRRTARSDIMYGPPWRLYVYRSYGIHWCANIVTGPTEQAAAVLLRAGEVVDGQDLARSRRGIDDPLRWAKGPGNLAETLDITGADLGVNVLDPASPVRLDRRLDQAPLIRCGPRVGVSRAADIPWRFWVSDDPTVSTYRRSKRA